ncbi:hypothetical protein [Adoxophyes orana nucleopolyhedrovirus]|uniref:hypothetical protein n=1 Tax=Adoxophyes orana nucleopolyhedrovirus TaxID=542343 RepID=UPI0001829C3E|nr:hypothetical protein [Adoxophyes orana nucleopolyhedrovirus]ACF05403.1 hypothetical protein [Adoxophyes orana nucleopolyhedrovirus]
MSVYEVYEVSDEELYNESASSDSCDSCDLPYRNVPNRDLVSAEDENVPNSAHDGVEDENTHCYTQPSNSSLSTSEQQINMKNTLTKILQENEKLKKINAFLRKKITTNQKKHRQQLFKNKVLAKKIMEHINICLK